MFEWIYAAIAIGAGLIVTSVFTSVLAFRFGAPLLLVFLILGLIAGEDFLGLEFDNANAAYFVGSIALAIILFDSGFGTSIQSFRDAAAPAITLATVGVVLTTVLTGAVAHALVDLTWPQALLLGAIVSSTDAAAVFFLLRVGGITIKERVRSTLEVESGSNDPMAIFLTITLVEIVGSGVDTEALTGDLAVGFIQQMGLGLLFGLGGGYLIVQMVNRVKLEGALYPIAVLAGAMSLFALTGGLGGSGFLAVYVAGLFAGNSRIEGKQGLRRFQEGMTWLAQIGMFLILGLLATPSRFPEVALPAILLGAFLIFVGRPLAVWLCLMPFSMPRNETAFISWVGLRGAVSILLAILPFIGGLDRGAFYFNVVFIMVLTSLLVQGWTIGPMARWLGLITPRRIGPVERIALDLPGTAHHELIVYRVVPDSPVTQGERLPRWARPSLVVRDGHSMRFQYAGQLRAGDYVYMFIAPRYARLLDRLFASPAGLPEDDEEFFGEFPIDPAKPLGVLLEQYESQRRETRRPPATTIREFMQERLGGPAEVGDRVAFGDLELIVREVDRNGVITGVRLSIEKREPKTSLPLFQSGRELLELIGRRFRSTRPKSGPDADGVDTHGGDHRP